MTDNEVADHAFLDGRLILREPRRGHRSGTDAILLAAAARPIAGQRIIDVGAGAGAAALILLRRVDNTTATLVERDAGMATLARHNIQANGFADRADVAELDMFERSASRATLVGDADVVISNPPFYLAGSVRASNDPQRAGSHILAEGGHGDWLRELLHFAKPGARVVLIHRPEAVPALLHAAEGRACVSLRSIHPRVGTEANRVILEAVPGKRTPCLIYPPIVLHNESGGFTAMAEDLHRGRRWI